MDYGGGEGLREGTMRGIRGEGTTGEYGVGVWGSMWEVLGREYGGMGEGGEGIPILKKGILRILISMCDFPFLLPESYVF